MSRSGRSGGDQHPLNQSRAKGFTLVELVFVVVIIALISSLALTRVESIAIWRMKGDMRKFVGTWEFLFQESLGRGEAYRLVLNLDQNTYFVRREVQISDTTVLQVDYLKNLRTKSEKARREAQAEASSIEEEFREEDARQSDSLENLFYDFAFSDPEGNVRLALPLEFPSLAEPKELTPGLKFLDVKVHGERYEGGEVFIRFSPRGASEFAVVHFQAQDETFTAMMNPSTGEIGIKKGYVDFEWSLGQGRHDT